MKKYERKHTTTTVAGIIEFNELGKFRNLNMVEANVDLEKQKHLIDSIVRDYPIRGIVLEVILSPNNRLEYEILAGKELIQSIVHFVQTYQVPDGYVGELNYFERKEDVPKFWQFVIPMDLIGDVTEEEKQEILRSYQLYK